MTFARFPRHSPSPARAPMYIWPVVAGLRGRSGRRGACRSGDRRCVVVALVAVIVACSALVALTVGGTTPASAATLKDAHAGAGGRPARVVRLLAGRLRRRHLLLRGRRLLRLDRHNDPQRAGGGHGRDPGQQGVLAGRLRRRRLLLRQRPVPRFHWRRAPQPPDRRHRRHAHRRRVLAGRLRRRDLRLRQRPVLRLHGRASRSTARSWAWPPRPRRRVLAGRLRRRDLRLRLRPGSTVRPATRP